MHFINYPISGPAMSAIESPPSLSAAWSEPWTVSGSGVMDAHDFYKSTFSASPPIMGIAAAVSSSSTNLSTLNDNGSTTSRKRVVNFKLDIKPEPEDACVPQMQKVPSISDLSDPDSSLDIPTQVRSLYFFAKP